MNGVVDAHFQEFEVSMDNDGSLKNQIAGQFDEFYFLDKKVSEEEFMAIIETSTERSAS